MPHALETVDQGEQLSPEKEGAITAKIMQECFQSFGLSLRQANEKIGALMVHAKEDGFRLFRIRDVVYTCAVTGKNMVEIHAMPGGKVKQDDKYRIKKLEETLPNMLAILHEIGTQTAYVSMPKNESKPYDKIMQEFGFTKRDIPEEYNAPDMIAYIVRLQ